MKKRAFIFTCACFVVLGVCLSSALAQQKTNVQYCAYSVGSTQYIWTAAHANLINKYSKTLQATPAFCGAETAVVKLLGQGKIEFGEVANLELEFAKRGEWGYSQSKEAAKESVKKIRAVFAQPYGSMQMITLADSGIKTYKDLKGKRVSLGSAAHTAHPILKTALAVEGLELKDYHPVYFSGGSGQGPDGCADRTLDAYYTNNPSRQPSSMNLATLNKIRLIGFSSPVKSKEFFDLIDKKYGKDLLRPITLQPGLYGKNQVNTEPVDCIAFDLVIATRADMSDDAVYEFTKQLFEHLPEFYETAGPDSKLITLQGAMKNVGFPFHPGALRYYKEKGLIK
ncbi:MAG: TAXI family TRAP transporter solute-binding subunit [Syntrophales bacterium]